jgi:hypothetical protein
MPFLPYKAPTISQGIAPLKLLPFLASRSTLRIVLSLGSAPSSLLFSRLRSPCPIRPISVVCFDRRSTQSRLVSQQNLNEGKL